MLAVVIGATAAQLHVMKNAFQEADVDSNGFLNIQEFMVLMKKHGIGNPAEVAEAFAAADQDGTKLVKYSEFIAAAQVGRLLCVQDQCALV